MKAINHPDSSKDPGKDGVSNSFATDAFAMTLEYFPGDYSRSGTGITSLATAISKTYYNGNIGGQSWRSQKPAAVEAVYGAGVNNPAMFTYEYDDRYQFSSNKYGTPDFGGSSFTEALNKNREYGLGYDANGNIQTLNRNDRDGNTLHSFTYNYQAGTNKLSGIAGYANYDYDVLGQLSHQQKGAMDMYLSYDVSGKVTGIYSDQARTQLKLSFRYDENGMRILKKDHDNNVETHYVYDASGNVLAIYDNNGTALQQKELPVYGADRLGMYSRLNGVYQYELKDHLGNVRVVLNEQKTPQGLADVVYYSDYYPYGMPMGLASSDYRYGYQGQYAEVDKESGWMNFMLRMYDPAIGRWLSTDPNGQYASPYVGMGNNPVVSIDKDGGVAWVATAAIGAVIGAGYSIFDQMYNEGKSLSDLNYKRVGLATLSGGLAGSGFVGVYGAAATLGLGEMGDQLLSSGKITSGEKVALAAGGAYIGGKLAALVHRGLVKVGVIGNINRSVANRSSSITGFAGKAFVESSSTQAIRQANRNIMEGLSSLTGSITAIELKKMYDRISVQQSLYRFSDQQFKGFNIFNMYRPLNGQIVPGPINMDGILP